MSLLINTSTQEHEALVTVEGEVDVSNAHDLRDRLDDFVQDVEEKGIKAVMVDVSAVPYIDSTGIGVFVGSAQRAGKRGIELTLKNPQRNVARVLGLLGLNGELGVSDEDAR